MNDSISTKVLEELTKLNKNVILLLKVNTDLLSFFIALNDKESGNNSVNESYIEELKKENFSPPME